MMPYVTPGALSDMDGCHRRDCTDTDKTRLNIASHSCLHLERSPLIRSHLLEQSYQSGESSSEALP